MNHLISRSLLKTPTKNLKMGNIASFSILEPAFLTGLFIGISSSYIYAKRRKGNNEINEKEVLSAYHEENFEVSLIFNYYFNNFEPQSRDIINNTTNNYIPP